jgi:hypothetical protein
VAGGTFLIQLPNWSVRPTSTQIFGASRSRGHHDTLRRLFVEVTFETKSTQDASKDTMSGSSKSDGRNWPVTGDLS